MKLVGSSLIFASWALVNGAQGNIINNNRNKNVESSFLNLVAGGSGGMRKQRKGGMMMRVTGNQQKAAKTPKIGGLRTNKKNQPLVPTFMFPESTAQTLVQEQDIIDGTWLLYNIVLEEEVYTVGGSDYKGQVHGVFCKIDLSAQKDDPSKSPFFMNFVREGGCAQAGNHVKLDLYDIVQKTRAFDAAHASDPLNTVKSIPPTAFLYHEGRCGSTLVSNSVTALEPERTRTYSEPLPPLLALLDCDKTRANCNVDKAANVFRDVVYMMGRTSNPVEDRLFFKLLPSSVLGVSVAKQAFPDVPWAFIYRDPVHVMVSNLREKHADSNAPGPYCTGLKKHKSQSEYIQDLVLSSSGKAVEELTREEYCAAYLATLTSAAAEEIAFTDGGMGVNYEDMPEILLDELFPKHFGLEVGEEETERVLAQFGVYSKRMKRQNPKEARDDSADKEKEASVEVREAVNLFLSDSYGKLQLLKNRDAVPHFGRQLTNKLGTNENEHSSAVTLYDPRLALEQRKLQPDPTFCNIVRGQEICCPQGSTTTVTSAGVTTISTVTTGGAPTTYPTCFFSYPACAWSTVGDCPFFTTTLQNTACSGLSYFYSTLTDFYDNAGEFCPEPTSSPTSSPTAAPTSVPTVSPTDLPGSSPDPTSSPTMAPTSGPTVSPTLVPTSQTDTPTSSPTMVPTSGPTVSPTLVPTSQTDAPTSSPTEPIPINPTAPPTSPPTAPPVSAGPTEPPTLPPTDNPTIAPTALPTSSPTITAMPTTTAAPTIERETLAPTGEFCAGTTPVCPAEMSSSGKGKGKGKSSSWGEDSVPICAVTETKYGTEYQTLCVTPSFLEELEDDDSSSSTKGRMKMKMGMMYKSGGSKMSKSSSLDIESYTCGCCDPILEGDGHPSFCLGRICEADPTPCTRYDDGGRRLLKQYGVERLLSKRKKTKKKKKKTNGMMKKKKRNHEKRPELPGVTICVEGETLCVDDQDPTYLGMDAADYECGAC